ncbi:N-acetylmuramoyl-L-alanine amidase family protein [Ectobacillus ponti]|uniref:N-acetylmuramoyl-L-alanine amidase n=1 Tax=Ectobacillus ponti TaxID=2961894 RepID=A0AA42BR19_9BACI|nr:N-acetylmuramoyl-L-alanine amidase [Ectobacillus ponti]MCP8966958.1 N-acetylmuramoyl-L-alanine amidase [Ectobacillus ponti]
MFIAKLYRKWHGEVLVDMKKWMYSTALLAGSVLLLWAGWFIWHRLQERQETVIVLDPGHGGAYPGFAQGGLLEKDIVFEVAKQTREILEQKGYRVYMTREGNSACSEEGYVKDLGCRPAVARKQDADLFVSIHANAFPGDAGVRGMEAFYFTPFRDKEAAEAIGAAVSEASGIPLRFTKFGNFKVLRDSIVPSTLIEIGYITNPQDAKLMADREGQRKIAEGIALGIQAFRPVGQPE